MNTVNRPGLASLLAVLSLWAAIPSAHAQRERLPPDDLDYVNRTWPNAQKLSTGIRYVVEHPGIGELAKPGDLISVLYEGRLLHGQVFESDQDLSHPFKFRLGRGQVIPGWDQIIKYMRPGETLLVIIPPELAYGSRGSLPRIPRDATLVFEIQLLSVEREQ